VITGTSPGVKLIHFGHRWEVFDLAADPLEARPLPHEDPRATTAKSSFDKLRGTLREVPPVY
jgi:hypothetical protein